MKSMIKILAVLVLCAVVAGAAEKGKRKTATEKTVTEDPVKKEFKQCDANRDGSVSLAEWKGANKPESSFKVKDKNNDGKLSRDEFAAEIPAAAEVKKYDRRSADQHLRRLKKLLEDGLLTKEMYDRKVAETEANIEDKPETTTAPAGKKK